MDASAVRKHAKTLLFHFIGDVCQSLVYGIYLIFFPVCMYLLSCKRSRASIVRMCLVSFTFVLCTFLWVATLVPDIETMLDLINGTSTSHNQAQLASSALAFLNFVISDGVVVWRARTLGKESKWGLRVCTVFLCLTAVTALLVVGVRAVALSSIQRPFFTTFVNVTQTVSLVVSSITNLTATTIISLKAWRCREEFRSVLRVHRRTQAEKILLLLVESGAAYCASGIIVIITTLIRLPHGTLGDIYQPVHSQLSGLYPAAVLVLVHQAKSLEETMFSVAISQSQPNPGNATRNDQFSVTLRFRHGDSLTVSSASAPSRRESWVHTDEGVEKAVPTLPGHDSPYEDQVFTQSTRGSVVPY